MKISNFEGIGQFHARAFYRRSTLTIDIVEELHVVPVQLGHDVGIKNIGVIGHDSPQPIFITFAVGCCCNLRFHRLLAGNDAAVSFLRRCYLVFVVCSLLRSLSKQRRNEMK